LSSLRFGVDLTHAARRLSGEIWNPDACSAITRSSVVHRDLAEPLVCANTPTAADKTTQQIRKAIGLLISFVTLCGFPPISGEAE
jgi:hypothetical protein